MDRIDRQVSLEAKTTMRFSVEASPRVKSNLSRRHFLAAQQFAKKSQAIEDKEVKLDWPQPGWEELKNYSISVVILNVAALESRVNEFYLDAKDQNSTSLPSLSQERMLLLSQRWPEVKLFSILQKYQEALTACNKEPMNKGADPFQSASLLIKLRNALVHFKPEWDGLQTHQKLEDQWNGRFSLCKLAERAKGQMVWFPNRCIGAGCASWACETAKSFDAEFCRVLEIPKCLD